ncbi:IclR family transcriptional regulator [Piscicoccus intestinalis]|uniref:IclR family transcriptional regulator n=1 Tax=Piscicoccus intestinalis TaxID=746033 RepID=UPI0009FBBB25|nr:IclR family transcriptional regulator [Piscicoccus intestinalis]
MAGGDEGVKLNQSVIKAITLLRATAADSEANISSLARTVGLPRATALRLIKTLEQEGFVLRPPGEERVLLGPELLRLARASDEQRLLQEVASPIVRELAEQVRETVTLSVVAADGGLDLVEQVDAPHQLRPRSWVGQRFPLHASASGKVLLSTRPETEVAEFLREPLPRYTAGTITTAAAMRVELQRIRTQGYAAARDEEEEGLTGIGVGIVLASGALAGVLTAAGPTQRLDGRRGRAAADQLRRGAARVAATLSGGRPRDALVGARAGVSG